MPPPPIYLDHNATAPILPEVAEAVRDAALRFPGNPASQHEPGRQARRALETARQRIGEILGARTAGMDADQVIFTSGGTESNNLALTGLVGWHALRYSAGRGDLPGDSPRPSSTQGVPPVVRLLISALEHPSITRTAEHLATTGVHTDVIHGDESGATRIDYLKQLLSQDFSGSLPLEGRAGEGVGSGYTLQSPLPNPPPQGEGTGGTEQKSVRTNLRTLVSVMLASNETGVLQPIAEIATLCRQHGALIHTDAVQAVGKIPVHFRDLGVDALTAAAHKFHGPLGIGVLIVRHGVPLASSLHGGFQQSTLRPGTESVALAIGMQTALELWHGEADARFERMTNLRDQFEQAILNGYPDAIIIGADAPRLPHTSNIAFTGLNRQALVMAFDLAGVACSTGSACASGSSEPSPTLLAMGLPDEVISSSVRFSLGATTTAAEISEAARRILSVCNHLRHEK
jgi:cysteine desulfurase